MSWARITDLQEQICASLWLNPGTLEELDGRDFLQYTATEWVDRWLMQMENEGKIYERNGVYYCYKKEAQRLNRKGYDLF